jgi:hypothetical protein
MTTAERPRANQLYLEQVCASSSYVRRLVSVRRARSKLDWMLRGLVSNVSCVVTP